MFKIFSVVLLAAMACLDSAQAGNMVDLCEGRLAPNTDLPMLEGLVVEDFEYEEKYFRCKFGAEKLHEAAKWHRSGRMCEGDVAGLIYRVVQESERGALIQELPSHVGEFIRAFSLEASAQCKINLLGELDRIDALLKPEEMAVMEAIMKSPARVVTDDLKFEQGGSKMQLVNKFMDVSDALSYFSIEGLSKEQTESLNKLTNHCRRIFAPVYKHTMMTITGMIDSNLDYPLDGPLLAAHKDNYNNNARLDRWLETMLACQVVIQTTNVFDAWDEDIPNRNSQVTTEAFPSPIVDKDAEAHKQMIETLKKQSAELQSMRIKAEKETKDALNKVYNRIVGDHLSVMDRIKFNWPKFLNIYAQKLSQTLVDNSV